MRDYTNNPSNIRIIGLLSFLLIALAIPLTVFMSQQQQDVRQFADDEGTNPCQTNPKSPGCECRNNNECSTNVCYIKPGNSRGLCSATSCNSLQGKPANCSCSRDNECASKKCAKASGSSTKSCIGGPVITPPVSPPPGSTPTPTPYLDLCTADAGRPDGCVCDRDNQCAKKNCKRNDNDIKTCGGGPVVTPNPSPTPTTTQGGGTGNADVDRNGCIGLQDFNEWLHAFQNNGTPRQSTFVPNINGDVQVDIVDFNVWFNAMRAGQNLCTT